MKDGILLIWLGAMLGIGQLNAAHNANNYGHEYALENITDEDEFGTDKNVADNIAKLVETEVKKQELLKELDENVKNAEDIVDEIDEIEIDQQEIKDDINDSIL
ncbi:MAG: hypothetical protein LBH49_01800 [Puniceicoccales bacterium]|jgi:hypothetical protein|nr:hypothetical protein [Puniceicoccales bacterium]